MTDRTHITEEPLVAQALQPVPHSRRFVARAVRAFSIAEVLVSLAILMAGIVAIASFFPMTLRHNQRAMDSSVAAYLAQLKAEEIRRDNDHTGIPGVRMIDVIQSLATPTAPVTFPPDPRFAYSFCGQSLLNPLEPASARVIVRYAATYRSQQEILFELAFQ